MRFTDVMAHLAVVLHDPLAEHTELLRALREGSEELEATERKLARMAAAEGHPFDWSGGTFKSLLYGKPGPGGGLAYTPAIFAFYITGYLLDCPRREVAAQALDMMFASVRGEDVCKETRQRYFGAALVGLLSNLRLFEHVKEIGVCGDRGTAHLLFDDGGRSLFYTPAYDRWEAGRYSVNHLYPGIIAPLIDLTNQPALTTMRGVMQVTERGV